MTDAQLTDITMILDRSGSMQTIKNDVAGGFAAFVDEQRREPGRCTLTLVQFDDTYEQVYVNRPIAEVPRLTLHPRGRTALLDAIGRTVSDTGARLSALPEDERPGTVIIGIMTDGLENASQEFTRPAVRAMIDEQEQRYSWTFLYLGANQDAVEVGTGLGIAAEQAMTYAPAAAPQAMAGYSSAVRRARRAAAGGATGEQVRNLIGFTEDQRRDAAG